MTTIDLAKLTAVCGGAQAKKSPGQQIDLTALNKSLLDVIAAQDQRRSTEQSAKLMRTVGNTMLCQSAQTNGVIPQWVDCAKWAAEQE